MYKSLTEARKMLEMYERMESVDTGLRIVPQPLSEQAARMYC